MTLTRWDPFRDLLNFQERLHRIIDASCKEGPSRKTASWCPAVDVLETPDAYIYRVELPGVGKENINIEVRGSHVIVSGDRPIESGPGIAAYHSIERVGGYFERIFRLPGHVDVDKSEAKYEDGVLEITLPKSESQVDRNIIVTPYG
jgi:HSP20 family protein